MNLSIQTKNILNSKFGYLLAHVKFARMQLIDLDLKNANKPKLTLNDTRHLISYALLH